MELIRDNLGFINLNNSIVEKSKLCNTHKVFSFIYNNKIYFYKTIDRVENIYNELIASELAKDYKINSLDYDIATYNEHIGVISENFITNNIKYIPMEHILISVYGDEFIDSKNNLEDIWVALDVYYKNSNITKILMDKIINIFIFDILIGNIDRHSLNYGIITKDEFIDIAPVFDNEKMLDESSIYYGDYSLGVDKNDYSVYTRQLSDDNNYIYKFINISDDIYYELLKEKLEIINSENINKVLSVVERKIETKIPELIRKSIVDKFDINRNMINNVINNKKYIKKNV